MTASVPRRRPPKVDTKRAEAKRACARHLEDLRRAHEEPPESVPPRRRPKIDTERAAAKRACARHLKDLRRAHEEPPADVAVSTRGLPKFVAPILEQSYCTSPAALCAELAE
ncbi:MAG TPA: hypothetical protein VKA12_01520 [Roseiarcus sp.]|nr:hypothetical protein [Roseiarcus sp.]